MERNVLQSVRLADLSPLLSWYEQSARRLPWRETRDPYAIWVSEIMLQQTRVEAVIPYYHRFLGALPNIKALAEAPEAQILKLWEGLGYYSRVRNMQKAAKVIMTEHGGVFPQDYEAILSLPGIGEYTAGAIGAFAFDLPVPAVDGNVLRVAARLSGFDGDVLSGKTKKILTAAVGKAQKGFSPATFNQAIIELGALVCVPNGVPKCHSCPLADRCVAHAKGLETTLPVRRAKTARRKEERTVLILREGERTALRKRPEKGLLAGLFEPFSIQGKKSIDEVKDYLLALEITPHYLTPLGDALHIFTHVEWHMAGYEVILPEGTLEKMAANGAENPFFELFLVPREEIDEAFAVPGAYRTYRAFM